MENKNKLIIHALQWGLILAFSRTLLDILLKVMDVGGILYNMSFFIGFILEVIIISVAVKIFKNKLNNGLLKVTDAIKIGVVMMIITALFITTSINFYEPDFLYSKTIEMMDKLQPDNLDEVIDKFEEAKANLNLFYEYAKYLGWFMFLGLLISAIAGAIMKKDEPAY